MCLYDDGDDYGITLVQRGERKARTEHKCSECSRVIDAGERYQYWVTVGGDMGGWTTTKMCAHCWGTIELGAALTGCPKYWYWDMVHDLSPDDGGFVGDILGNHDLDQADRYKVLRTVVGRRCRWRNRRGDLLPVPTPAASQGGSDGAS